MNISNLNYKTKPETARARKSRFARQLRDGRLQMIATHKARIAEPALSLGRFSEWKRWRGCSGRIEGEGNPGSLAS